jgi:geranylgeranyl pyrophosphate synthase
MKAKTVAPPGGESGLRTDSLADLWDYAMKSPSKQTRSKVLVAAQVAARGGSGELDPRTAIAVQAVETLHLATLAHDDVVDAGDLRRGIASLPAFFGAPTAAGAGGVFFGRALNLFARCGDEAVVLASETAMRLCKGQMLEFRALRDHGRTSAEYFDAIKGKTAGLFWLAANLGGLLGGADPVAMEALAWYGETLGIAYQIIDDVLDLTGDPRDMGKPRGNDLKNGNYTLPVIYALEQRPELANLLQDEAPVETVISWIRDSHAIRRASTEARCWIEKTKDAVRWLAAPRELLEIANTEIGVLDDSWA